MHLPDDVVQHKPKAVDDGGVHHGYVNVAAENQHWRVFPYDGDYGIAYPILDDDMRRANIWLNTGKGFVMASKSKNHRDGVDKDYYLDSEHIERGRCVVELWTSVRDVPKEVVIKGFNGAVRIYDK